MGVSSSDLRRSQLCRWTPDEVAAFVATLGDGFISVSKAIESKEIAGDIVVGLADDEEMQSLMLDVLGLASRQQKETIREHFVDLAVRRQPALNTVESPLDALPLPLASLPAEEKGGGGGALFVQPLPPPDASIGLGFGSGVSEAPTGVAAAAAAQEDGTSTGRLSPDSLEQAAISTVFVAKLHADENEPQKIVEQLNWLQENVSSPYDSEKWADAGAITTICALMEKHPSNAPLQLASLRLIVKLCDHCQRARKLFGLSNPSACFLVPSVMKNFPSDPRIQSAGCEAVAMLIRNVVVSKCVGVLSSMCSDNSSRLGRGEACKAVSLVLLAEAERAFAPRAQMQILEHGLVAVINLSFGSERNCAQLIAQTNLCSTLLKLLRAVEHFTALKTPSILHLACWAVVNLSSDDRALSCMVEDGACELLPQFLQSSQDEKLLEMICLALINFSEKSGCDTQLVAAGAGPALIRVLTDFPNNQWLLQHALQAVAALFECGEVAQDALVKAGACEKVVEVMRNNLLDTDVQTQGCGAVLAIAQSGAKYRHALRDAGACEQIVKALDSFPGDVYVQGQGSGAASYLAEDSESAARFLVSGAIPALVRAVRRFGMSQEGAGLHGISAVSIMAQHGPTEARVQIVEQGALSVLSMALHTEDGDLVRAACLAIMRLCVDASIRSAAGAAGCCELLVRELGAFAFDRDVVVSCLCAACSLVMDNAENRRRLVRAGVGRFIVKALSRIFIRNFSSRGAEYITLVYQAMRCISHVAWADTMCANTLGEEGVPDIIGACLKEESVTRDAGTFEQVAAALDSLAISSSANQERLLKGKHDGTVEELVNAMRLHRERPVAQIRALSACCSLCDGILDACVQFIECEGVEALSDLWNQHVNQGTASADIAAGVLSNVYFMSTCLLRTLGADYLASLRKCLEFTVAGVTLLGALEVHTDVADDILETFMCIAPEELLALRGEKGQEQPENAPSTEILQAFASAGGLEPFLHCMWVHCCKGALSVVSQAPTALRKLVQLQIALGAGHEFMEEGVKHLTDAAMRLIAIHAQAPPKGRLLLVQSLQLVIAMAQSGDQLRKPLLALEVHEVLHSAIVAVQDEPLILGWAAAALCALLLRTDGGTDTEGAATGEAGAEAETFLGRSCGSFALLLNCAVMQWPNEENTTLLRHHTLQIFRELALYVDLVEGLAPLQRVAAACVFLLRASANLPESTLLACSVISRLCQGGAFDEQAFLNAGITDTLSHVVRHLPTPSSRNEDVWADAARVHLAAARLAVLLAGMPPSESNIMHMHGLYLPLVESMAVWLDHAQEMHIAGDGEVLEAHAKAIVTFTREPHACSLVCSFGGADVICDTIFKLRNLNIDLQEKVWVAAVAALANLSGVKDNHAMLIECGVSDAVMAVIVRVRAADAIAESGEAISICTVISNLCHENESMKVALGTPEVMRAAIRFVTMPSVQGYAFAAIRNLASKCDPNKLAFIREGACQAIGAAVIELDHVTSKDAFMVEQACWAMKNLASCSGEAAFKLHESGALTGAVQIVDVFLLEEAVTEAALVSIATILLGLEECCTSFSPAAKERKQLQALMRAATSSFPSNTLVQRSARVILSSISFARGGARVHVP
jgi:hypothetical protein